MGTKHLQVFSSAGFLCVIHEEYCSTASINSLPEFVPVLRTTHWSYQWQRLFAYRLYGSSVMFTILGSVLEGQRWAQGAESDVSSSKLFWSDLVAQEASCSAGYLRLEKPSPKCPVCLQVCRWVPGRWGFQQITYFCCLPIVSFRRLQENTRDCVRISFLFPAVKSIFYFFFLVSAGFSICNACLLGKGLAEL